MIYKVNYEALRSIDPTHTINTVYEIEFEATQFNVKTLYNKNVVRTLDGSRETLFIRDDGIVTVTSSFVSKVMLPFWKEFLDSVKIGETFSIFEGTTEFIVTMDEGNYNPQRSGLVDNDFTFTFIARINNL